MRSFLASFVLLTVALTVSAQTNAVGQGIITVLNGKFVDANCREYQFAGANVWQLLEKTVASASVLQPFFAAAAKDNINVIRTFAHGSTPMLSLQPSAGQYNENAFKALDQIIAAADKAGVKLILTLTDNWSKGADGKEGFVAAAGLQHPEDFYTNPKVLQLYLNHQMTMANRVNTVNGRMYKNEPAILAWDLMNEPRSGCDTSHANATCEAGETAAIQGWIDQTAKHMKSVDPNHMVSVGEEGFYGFGASAAQLATNPNSDSSGWSEKAGQNFAANHASSNIDFGAVHIWTDNWSANAANGVDPVQFINNFLQIRSSEMAAIGKPLVIEEFGKQLPIPATAAQISQTRDPIFRAVYSALQNLPNVKGVAYWERAIDGAASSDNLVRNSDSTWTQILQPAAAAVAQRIATLPAVAGCTPGRLRQGSSANPDSLSPGAGNTTIPANTTQSTNATPPSPAAMSTASLPNVPVTSPPVQTSPSPVSASPSPVAENASPSTSASPGNESPPPPHPPPPPSPLVATAGRKLLHI